MVRRLIVPDSVAVTGCAIGLASLPLGWLVLKPSRLAAGTGFRLLEAVAGDRAALIITLWAVCMVLSLMAGNKIRAIISGVIANVIMVLTLVFAGTAASELLSGEPTFARVSLGIAIWLGLVGAYFVIYASRFKLKDAPLARNLISWSGLVAIALLALSGWFNDFSVVQELLGREQRFLQEMGRHFLIFGVSVSAGTAIGIPLGIWAVRSRRAERPVLYITNITQTIPSLALFGFLIAPLSALSFAYPAIRELGVRGVGIAPALIALTIYSLLPIVSNTYVGLRNINPAIIDAGSGMGMSRGQVFRKVELPIAAPLILEGVRTAAVTAVGLTTVAALIGAGGLGWFIFQGIGQAAADLIILGAMPVIVLALVVDIVLRTVVRRATPKGLRLESTT